MSTTKSKSTEAAKPPVAKLRQGLLYASIWKQTTKGRTHYSVTFERRYIDKSGTWHSTQSISGSDLVSLANLMERAHVEVLNLYSTSE